MMRLNARIWLLGHRDNHARSGSLMVRICRHWNKCHDPDPVGIVVRLLPKTGFSKEA